MRVRVPAVLPLLLVAGLALPASADALIYRWPKDKALRYTFKKKQKISYKGDSGKVVESEVHPGSRTFTGLRYLLAGYSYRESAKECGLAGHRPLRDAVIRLGIQDAVASTNRAVSQYRQVRQLVNEEFVRRFSEDGIEQEKARDLAIVGGIAHDKIVAHESAQGSNNSALDALEAIGKRIAEAGVKLDISISPVAAYLHGESAAREPVTREVEPTGQTRHNG